MHLINTTVFNAQFAWKSLASASFYLIRATCVIPNVTFCRGGSDPEMLTWFVSSAVLLYNAADVEKATKMLTGQSTSGCVIDDKRPN